MTNKREQCDDCKRLVEVSSITPLRVEEDILPYLNHFRAKRQEYLVCLSLDSSQRLIARRIITIGLLDEALVHPREVFAGALTDRAASVIIAHNHPSGDVRPSKQDINTTQQLIAAGILLGIPLRDHFIVAVGSYYSFRREGLILLDKNHRD